MTHDIVFDYHTPSHTKSTLPLITLHFLSYQGHCRSKQIKGGGEADDDLTKNFYF